MARQILPIAGAIIGAYFGSPQLGFAIGSIIGNAVDPEVIQGPRIGDAGIQTSAEGVFRPVVFGTAAVMGNVIERGNRQIQTDRQSQGKGGPVVETERVYWTFAIRICEGPIAGVTRIWMDEKLVYDIRPGSAIPDETNEFEERFRLYLGDEDQLPDPDIEAFRGIGNTPAYRGTAYIVFPNYDLTDRRESIPNFRFEVSSLLQTTRVGTILASGETSLNSYRTSSSVDGTEWDAPRLSPFSTTYLVSGNGVRFIAFNNEGAHYSDEYGAPWIPADTDAFTGIGVGTVALQSGPVIVIGAGPDGVYRSFDNGITYDRVDVDGIFPVYMAGPLPSIMAASPFSPYAFVGTNYGSDWRLSFAPHGLTLGSGGAAFGYGGTQMLAGEYAGVAAVSYTMDDGDTWQIRTFDAEVGAFVTALCAAQVGTYSMWIAGLNNGRLYMSVNRDTWTIVHDLGVSTRFNSIVHNGERFLAGGGLSGGGVILESQDGDDWNEVTGNPLTYSVISIAAQAPIAPVGVVEPVVLGDIVAAIHQRVQQTPSDYDVSALDDLVDGVVFAGDYTCADSIRSLMAPYFFDSAEYDDGSSYAIRYVKRGAPVVDTIVFDDLIDLPERSTREDALERPKTLHVAYQSPTIGYAAAKATVTRDSLDVEVVGELSIQLPVAFSDIDEIRQIAHKLHKIAWVEVGGEEQLSLGDNWLHLIPSDCIGVYLRGQSRRLRITQELSETGQQRYRLMADRQSAYTSNITGIPLPEPTPPLPSVVGLTIFEFLDIPALNDNNDRLLYYVGATGQTEAWYGALVQRQVPPSTSWEDATTFNRVNTIMGTLLEDIPSANSNYPDTTNVVRVSLFSDDVIEAISHAEFLSEGGSFALEKPDGSFEVMQYRDVEEDSGGNFLLSYLARGRLNSGPSEHLAGARFVLLDGVHSVDAVTSFLNTDLTHRAISFGMSADETPTYTDGYVGRSQIEFPVADILLERDTNTINARTIPRHRFGTEDNPIRSINWQAYRWNVTDGTNTINRDGTSETESFDVTGWSSPVSVTVSQVNRITGAGPSLTESIP